MVCCNRIAQRHMSYGLAVQAQLKDAQAQAEKWKSALQDVARAVGFALPSTREPEVSDLVDHIQNIRMSEKQLQVCTLHV